MAAHRSPRSLYFCFLLVLLMSGAVTACSGGAGFRDVPDGAVEGGRGQEAAAEEARRAAAEEARRAAAEEARRAAAEEARQAAAEEARQAAAEEARRAAAEEARRAAAEEARRAAAEEARRAAAEEARQAAAEEARRAAAEEARQAAAEEARRAAAAEAARRAAAAEEGMRRETAVSDRSLQRSAETPRSLIFEPSYFAPDISGGQWLRVPSTSPYGGKYYIVDRVPNWSDSSHAIKWPSLVMEELPSDTDLPHGVGVAYTKAVGGGVELKHAAYGWWAIVPTVDVTPRLTAVMSGLSLGTQTLSGDMPGGDTAVTATWRGRATGVGVGGASRWVLAGDVELNATLRGAKPGKVNGKITNTRIASVDGDLRDAGKTGNWYTVVLGSTAVNGNAYSGTATVSSDVPEGFTGPRYPNHVGWYTGMFYGSGAAETAGKGYLFESTPNWDSDNSVVFGFGARK